MSELIKKRVKSNVGKTTKIFLVNNFRFEGKITNSDDEYVEILDFKTNSYKLILISEIKEMEVKNE